jgi:membrane protein YdbS with pleckstrin-like domain
MTVIGWMATVLLGIVILVGIFVAVTALPDLNRYRRLRKM